MKAMIKLFGAAVLAASVTLAMSSCQKENNVEEPRQHEVDAPETTSGIHVNVGAGIVDTKSAVVTDGDGNRTLTFTSGDQLYVRANLQRDFGNGNVDCVLTGYLDIATIGDGATSATFEGDLSLYKYESWTPELTSYDFGTDNPLDLCTSARAVLVHEGTSTSFTPGIGYFEQVAPTVEELMTTCLNVSGDYDKASSSFSLSAVGTSGDVLPVFNCTISGLTPNTPYEVYLLIGNNAEDASGNMALGGKTSDGMGQLTFACYYSISAGTPYYYAFRFKDGNNWMRAELGTKQLQSKVYNINRTAVADPASPVMPNVTGTAGTWNTDLSVYYSDVADITISGTSKGYYFNVFAGGTVRLDNLSASYHVNPFIHSRAGLNIVLTGDNSISSKSCDCIQVFSDVNGNNKHEVRLSCTGSSATLSLTYDGSGVWGITADNYEHEPLDGSYNPVIVSNQPVPELAETGYSVELTTVHNSDGTWTSTYTVTRTGLLNGLFTINAGGDKVRFSEGNLRYSSTSVPGQGTWSFAPQQYSIIGNAENNTYTATASAGKSMDLFCWGATGLVDTGALGVEPINPDVNFANSDPNDPDPYYYSGGNALSGIYEWGNVSISNTSLTNWRTLTNEEWEYLFRDNTKYGPATVAGCAGIVLLPDSFSDPKKNGGSGAFVSSSQISNTGYTDNVYSAENWKAMEYAGAVFLPAGGIFYGGEQGYWSGMGYYWTSTPNTNGNTKAYFFAFLYGVCEVRSGDTNSGDSGVYRSSRLSVRLVRTAN
jgi:hypothetical protein